MAETIRDLSRRLGRRAEAVCGAYLSNGRRQERYWIVGDVRNAPGRSTFVRLFDSPAGPAGKWTDAATGEHGDLLDIIRESCGLTHFADVADEARRFLGLPDEYPPAITDNRLGSSRPRDPRRSARRLFASAKPIPGTLAEAYLRNRGIPDLRDCPSLRFHPRCYHRPDDDGPTETWPALIAAVTDLDGKIVGVHRTWLARDGSGKAPLATPRRALGDLAGYGVRFGTAGDVVAVGEGIETVLSLRTVMPTLPMVAALSSANLAALILPTGLQRLYIAEDNDTAGRRATAELATRAAALGIKAIVLTATLGDFNDDLRHRGFDHLRAAIQLQIATEDVERFLTLPR